MLKIGIIAEFNPLHFGHIHFFKEIKKRYPHSLVVAAISGNFTQRGTPSLIEKYNKTKLALDLGIDLVVEIPQEYAIQAGDYFGKAAVETLLKIPVDIIIAGSESANLERLETLSKKEISSDKSLNLFQKFNSEYLKNSPNDTLNLGYIKALNGRVPFETIKRDNSFNSGTFIRNNLNQKDILLPKNVANLIETPESIFSYLEYTILKEGKNIKKYFLVNEGLESRIIKKLKKVDNIDDLIISLKSRKHTTNYIRRFLLSIYLGIQEPSFPSYLKVLGFNQEGRKLLNSIKEEVQIVTTNNDTKRIDKLYYLLLNKNYQDIKKPIIIL